MGMPMVSLAPCLVKNACRSAGKTSQERSRYPDSLAHIVSASQRGESPHLEAPDVHTKGLTPFPRLEKRGALGAREHQNGIASTRACQSVNRTRALDLFITWTRQGTDDVLGLNEPGAGLTPAARTEAEGLVDLAEFLALLRLRTQRVR